MIDATTATSRIQHGAGAVADEHGEITLATLADPALAERAVRFHADLAALAGADYEGAVVLDAGCGDGISSVVLAALGASVVHAVDVAAEKIETLERTRGAFGDLGGPLRPTCASVFELPLEDASIDIIVSNEAIGVYRDVGAFIDECARVLKPGGVALMAEINDVKNPRLRARARQLWRAYELGPSGEYDGHIVGSTYVEQRAELIRTILTEAPPEVVAQIAERTFRHDAAAVRAACAHWAATGELPSSPYDPELAPMDLDGLLVEAPIDPGWMCEALRERGLRPAVRGYWGGAAGSVWTRAIDRGMRALGPLALPTARAVRYIGVKAKTPA